MLRTLTGVVFGITSLLLSASVAIAADPAPNGPPISGSITLAGKTFRMTHAIAYQCKDNNDRDVIAILATSSPIDPKAVLDSLKENDNRDSDVDISGTYLRMHFDTKGKLQSLHTATTNTTIFNQGKGSTTTFEIKGKSVVGSVDLPLTDDDTFARAVKVSFNLPVINHKEAGPIEIKYDELRDLGVIGKYHGQGKHIRTAFVSAREIEDFNDKPAIQIIITEKDHSKAENPSFIGLSGDYGASLTISCFLNGDIFGCEVSHPRHEKRPFSSVGKIEMTEFQIHGGQVQGRLQTDGEVETFDQTWEVDLVFAAKFAGHSKAPKVDAQVTAAQPKASDDDDGDDAPEKEMKPSIKLPPGVKLPGGIKIPGIEEDDEKPAGDMLAAKDLATPAGAENFEYKKLVEHMSYTVAGGVKVVAGEVSKALAAQGWKTDGSDLVTANSAILNRKRGEASLTIFVKPEGESSKVQLITEGLAW